VRPLISRLIVPPLRPNALRWAARNQITKLKRNKTMWPDNRILKLLGIELPIIQAPVAGVAFSEMVVDVCEAGGLGSLACGWLTPQQIAQEVEIIRRLLC